MDEPIYKFLDKAHVAPFLSGRLLLHSLAYFAEMELASGVAGIGDQFEAGPRVEIEHFDTTNATADELATLRRLGFHFAEGAKATLASGIIGQSAAHSHVLCLTKGDLATQAALFPYDAAIEVFDLPGLIDAIVNEGHLVCPGAPPVREAFTAISSGLVTYSPKVGDLSSPSVLQADAFVKPPAFAGQREVRVLFIAADEGIHDRIMVQVPNMERFVRQVSHPGSTVARAIDFEPVGGRPEANFEAELASFEDKLRALVQDVAEFEAETQAKSEEFIDAKSAALQLAERRTGSSAGALADAEYRAISHELWLQMTKYTTDRSAQFEKSFERRISQIKWRARLYHRLRPTGIVENFNEKLALDFLKQRVTSNTSGPARMYYRETRFGYEAPVS